MSQQDRANKLLKSVTEHIADGEGAIVFVFDYGNPGEESNLTWVSTADRGDAITMLLEYIATQDKETLGPALLRLAELHRFGPDAEKVS